MKTNFTQIPNEILDNKNLSLEQKAVLAIFYRNSDEWKMYQKELESRSKNGRDAHTKILKSLCDLGFIERVKDNDLRDTSTGKFIKGEIYWMLVKSTVDWKPVTGNQQLETGYWFAVTNNTNTNNTKEIKLTEEESASAPLCNTEFLNTVEEVFEEYEGILFEEYDLDEVYTNFEEVQNGAEADFSVSSFSKGLDEEVRNHSIEIIPTQPSVELNTVRQPSTQTVYNSAQTSPSKKYFFRLNEKPTFHQLEEFYHSKGYSSTQALEMHKKLISTDFKDASGQQIKFLDSYLSREMSNLRQDISSEAIEELSADVYRILSANYTEDEFAYRYHSIKIDSKEFVQKYISQYGLTKTEKVIGWLEKQEITCKSSQQLSTYIQEELNTAKTTANN